MSILTIFRVSLRALGRNIVRSFLSCLGIGVGIVAVIAAVTIGLSFLFVKVSLSYASPLQALFFRFLIAFLGSLVLIMTGITKLNLRGKKLLPVLAPALLLGLGLGLAG